MHQLTQAEIDKIISGDIALFDVRSSEELAEKSCKYAQHIDVQSLLKGDLPDVAKDTPIMVYCRSGSRSALAQQILVKAGFGQVHNIGGIHDVPAVLCQEEQHA